MDNPMISKLAHAVALDDADRARLDDLVTAPVEMAARTEIAAEGQGSDHLRIVLSGYACRYKILADGQRAIVGLMLPGDVCDLHVQILGAMDHSIGTITECEVAFVGHDEIDALLIEFPRIARALWWSTLVDESILRQWLTNKGRLRADRQMIHLFCELYVRLEAVGLTHDHGFSFPLTQEELADTLGIATVHAHRVLTTLRTRRLVSDQGRRIRFPDSAAAVAFASFDPAYLHLRSAPASLS